MKPREECLSCVIWVKKGSCEYTDAAKQEKDGCRYKKQIKRQNEQTIPPLVDPEIPPESAH